MSSRYLEHVQNFLSSGRMSWDDFLEHIALQNEAPPEGPLVGAKIPEFALLDQQGSATTAADVCGPAGLLLVFVRSVHWCGYCRNQLGELNLSLPGLRAAGFGIAAITPDAVELVAEFADAQNIGFPILSDRNAYFIEQIGLLNPNVAGAEMQNGGRICFPAHLLLAADGTVLAKDVVKDLRHRPSATALVMQAVGPTKSSPQITIARDELTACIFLSTARVHAGQEIGVHLKVDINPGWHVYGKVEHARYAELTLRFADELLADQQIDIPNAGEKSFEELGEKVPAFEGVVNATGRLRLAWSPPVHGSRHLTEIAERLASMQMSPGAYELKGWFEYQACGHGLCTSPQRVPFTFPIRVEADVDKTRSVFASETAK